MPTKRVKVRAHDRVDGTHVRQHTRRIETAGASYQEELPPEEDFQAEEPAEESSASGPAPAGKTDTGKVSDKKESK